MKERTPTSTRRTLLWGQARTNTPFFLAEFSQGGLLLPKSQLSRPPHTHLLACLLPVFLFPFPSLCPSAHWSSTSVMGLFGASVSGVGFHSNLTSSFPSIGPHPRYPGDQDNWCSVCPFVSPSHNRLCW